MKISLRHLLEHQVASKFVLHDTPACTASVQNTFPNKNKGQRIRMLLCSLSNTPTPHPVLSLKSHRIFDQHALSTYVSTHGTDPITNDAMNMEDIIPVTTAFPDTIESSSAVANPEYSSIPTMLASFQSAWDSLSLELYHLRKELSVTKKQLSLALYRQDAAVNVAVKACEERDEAKQALAKLIADPSNAPVVKDVEMEDTNNENNNSVDESNVKWGEISSNIKKQQEELLHKHKAINKALNKVDPFGVTKASDLKIHVTSSLQLSKQDDSIHIMEINEGTKKAVVALTSGAVQVVDISVSPPKILSKLPSTTKSKNPVAFWLQDQPYALTVTPPRKNAKVSANKYSIVNAETKQTIQINSDLEEITLAAAHPTLPLYILAGGSNFEIFYNHESIFTQELSAPLSGIKFHPDGLYIGLSYFGASSLGLDIYDLSERALKLNIQYTVSEDEKLIDFVFGRNAYYLFLSTTQKLKVFDMRKNAIALETILPNENEQKLVIDPYTSLIAVGDSFVLFDKKQKTFSDLVLGDSASQHISNLYSSGDKVSAVLTQNTGPAQISIVDFRA